MNQAPYEQENQWAMAADWERFRPEWARGLKDHLPEDVVATYVSHDLTDETGAAPEQRARVLALAPSGLFACQAEARVRTATSPASMARFRMEWLPLSGIRVIREEFITGQRGRGEPPQTEPGTRITLALARDLLGWGDELTLPMESTDYGGSSAGEEAARRFVASLMELLAG